MSEINRALGAAGAPYPLTAGGKTDHLTPLTKGVQGGFEQWLKAQARAEIHAMKSELSQEDYIAALAKVAREGAAGVYDFTGDVAEAARHRIDGLVQMLWLMLRKHQPSMTTDETYALVLEHTGDCVAALNDITASLGGNAPGPGSPATTPAGA
jgi:hypothetical protein